MARRRVALVLGALGLAISVYLTMVHYHGAPLACPMRGIIDCEQVVTSPQSVILGLPLALWGVVWFLVFIGLTLQERASGGPPWLQPARFWWLLLGAASVVYFIYLELMVIGKICIWCSGVHLIVLILLAMEMRPRADVRTD